MKFDKTRVYTALNADELKVGSKVYVSDNIYYLKKCVEDNLESCILTEVLLEKEANRFCIDDKSNEKWQLAYLIEPPAEPKYKPFESVDKAREAINKHGGWVSSRDYKNYFFIISYATNLNERIGICTGPIWHNLQELYDNFIFADDGTPCGELVEGLND